MDPHCYARGRDTHYLLALLFFAACSSSENDALLLNIDEAPLQQFVTHQLSQQSSPAQPQDAREILPIVLVHGMAGFAPVGSYDYFYQIPQLAQEHHYTVVVAHTDPFQTVAYRAQQLAIAVDHVLHETGAPRVHLVAHSQGGLDARYLISTLGYGDRIATLVTLGTPHHGVRVADIALQVLPNTLTESLASIVNAMSDALLGGHADVLGQLEDLTTSTVRGKFNKMNLDDERVAYFSYAGYTQTHRSPRHQLDVVTPMLLLTHKLTRALEGDNDGLVSHHSAQWGTFMGTLQADHWDEIGQLPSADHRAFEHRNFYMQVLEALHTSGVLPVY